MLKLWIEYFWTILANFLNIQHSIFEGRKKSSQDIRGNKNTCQTSAMADKDKQVAVIGAGNREVESESVSETTLTEISKDLGNTKSLEKKAEYEEHNKESVVEEHKSSKSESNKQVTQSVKHEVSENRQVTHTTFSSSESFSMEESEEYEFDGDGTPLAITQK